MDHLTVSIGGSIASIPNAKCVIESMREFFKDPPPPNVILAMRREYEIIRSALRKADCPISPFSIDSIRIEVFDSPGELYVRGLELIEQKVAFIFIEPTGWASAEYSHRDTPCQPSE